MTGGTLPYTLMEYILVRVCSGHMVMRATRRSDVGHATRFRTRVSPPESIVDDILVLGIRHIERALLQAF